MPWFASICYQNHIQNTAKIPPAKGEANTPNEASVQEARPEQELKPAVLNFTKSTRPISLRVPRTASRASDSELRRGTSATLHRYQRTYQTSIPRRSKHAREGTIAIQRYHPVYHSQAQQQGHMLTRVRPEIPTKAETGFRVWNTRFSVLTFELSAIRHIVKARSWVSEPESQYQPWIDPHENDDDELEGPISFSDLKPNSKYMFLSCGGRRVAQATVCWLGRRRVVGRSRASADFTPSESGSEGLLLPVESPHPHKTKGPVQPETVSRVGHAISHHGSDSRGSNDRPPRVGRDCQVQRSTCSQSRRQPKNIRRASQMILLEPAKRRKEESSFSSRHKRKESPSLQNPRR